jgi:excisionase family DNA binding protein
LRRLHTVEEVAETLQLSGSTVRRAIRSGLLATVRVGAPSGWLRRMWMLGSTPAVGGPPVYLRYREALGEDIGPIRRGSIRAIT